MRCRPFSAPALLVAAALSAGRVAGESLPKWAVAACGSSGRSSCSVRFGAGPLVDDAAVAGSSTDLAWATLLPAGPGGWLQLEVSTLSLPAGVGEGPGRAAGSAAQLRSAGRQELGSEVARGVPAVEDERWNGPWKVDPDSLRLESYAAGLVEGLLTCHEVAAYWHNVYSSTLPVSDEALEFILAQDSYYRTEAQRRAASDDYWHAVAMVLAQFDGLLEGYQLGCVGVESPMTHQELLLLNLDGDLFDILVAFPTTPPPAVTELETVGAAANLAFHPRVARGRASSAARVIAEVENRTAKDSVSQNLRMRTRCSALFRLLPDGSDVYFGHDTWDTFATAAPRIFKTYALPVRRGDRIERHVNAFSSSPGYVSSVDDYYTIAGTAELAVIETSLNVQDPKAYRALRPETVPCWLRAMTANMLARNASDWVELFTRHHSGTYNNQWMVLDLSIFAKNINNNNNWEAEEGEEGQGEGLFWVLEEAPGLVVSADMSAKLRKDLYWPSFNVAFFPEIRQRNQEAGSWEEAPRARLFRQLHHEVTSIEGMQAVMAWNDYRHSNISKGPGDAIMARDDLATDGRAAADGGLDSKVSSFSHYQRGMATFARVGPTHDDVPPFCWGENPKFDRVPHKGHPRCFNFTWERLWPGRSEPEVFV
ncbi:unnamed protein product [Polarella glacialis]|uniref:Phospholipase B-like n=1 Tax=Polarella glacialis TaxID=89957 RepID=A0A813DJN1_POLGL|nr:unnamed protein product [Polarella glacialis]CAE8640538.1 unnamed protein product [Polarella glacialis]